MSSWVRWVGVGLAVLLTLVGSSPARAESGPRSTTATRQAVLATIADVSGSTDRLARALSRLAAQDAGLGGRAGGLFKPYVAYGEQQRQWMDATLAEATRLTQTGSEVEDPDLALALLRLTGPRLQAALFGTQLLSAWVDFLSLADVVIQQCPAYSVEQLFMDLDRVQQRLVPSFAALSSRELGRVETTATALPGELGELTREFQSIRDAVRVSTERVGRWIAVAQVIEMVAMASTMKLSLPRLPPAAPALLGVRLGMSAHGVMMGTQVVVSAEWMEMMRRLVQAGVISVPVASAAIRIQAGQVLMSQANDGLPKGVRDALGDGPEVRAMRPTDKAGAGMAEQPQHHVLPREHREWFEKRGFTGELDIDQFCVRMEQSHHEAIHGGGDWRQGRQWPGEWNQLVMNRLRDAELLSGRMLTRGEILERVAFYMKRYDIPMNFTPWRGR